MIKLKSPILLKLGTNVGWVREWLSQERRSKYFIPFKLCGHLKKRTLIWAYLIRCLWFSTSATRKAKLKWNPLVRILHISVSKESFIIIVIIVMSFSLWGKWGHEQVSDIGKFYVNSITAQKKSTDVPKHSFSRTSVIDVTIHAGIMLIWFSLQKFAISSCYWSWACYQYSFV